MKQTDPKGREEDPEKLRLSMTTFYPIPIGNRHMNHLKMIVTHLQKTLILLPEYEFIFRSVYHLNEQIFRDKSFGFVFCFWLHSRILCNRTLVNKINKRESGVYI